MPTPKKKPARKPGRPNRDLTMEVADSATLFPYDAAALAAFKAKHLAQQAFSQTKMANLHASHICGIADANPSMSAKAISAFLKGIYQGKGVLSAEFDRAVAQIVNDHRGNSSMKVAPTIVAASSQSAPHPSPKASPTPNTERTSSFTTAAHTLLSDARALTDPAPLPAPSQTASALQRERTPQYATAPSARPASAIQPTPTLGHVEAVAASTTGSTDTILCDAPRIIRRADGIMTVKFSEKWIRDGEDLANKFFGALYYEKPYHEAYLKLLNDDSARNNVCGVEGERREIFETIIAYHNSQAARG